MANPKVLLSSRKRSKTRLEKKTLSERSRRVSMWETRANSDSYRFSSLHARGKNGKNGKFLFFPPPWGGNRILEYFASRLAMTQHLHFFHFLHFFFHFILINNFFFILIFS